jgi:hypothetical protein
MMVHHRPRIGIHPVTESVVLPPNNERSMINPPQFASYSVPARIFLGVAIFGVLLFAVMTSIYFMR